MRKVRIVRNRVNFRQALFRFSRLVQVCLGIYAKHTRAADHDYIVEARHRKLVMDTQVAEQRLHKISNDVILGDLKIEEKRRELGMTGGGNVGQEYDSTYRPH